MIDGFYSHLPLVTPEVVAKTVMNDGQTRLWFRKLLASPLVVKLVTGGPGDGRRLYRLYRAYSVVAVMLGTVATGSLIVGKLLLPQYFMVWLTVGGCSICGAVLFWRSARKWLAKVAAYLIEINRDAVQDGVTLYQLGEIWSRKYGVPSMVDTIWLWDQCLRKSFLALYFFAFGVYFLPFWKVLIWTTAGCCLVIICVQIVVLIRRNL